MQNIENTYTKRGFKVLTDKQIQTSAVFFCWAPQRTLERHRRPVWAAAQHSAVSICSNKHDLRAQFTPRLCFRYEWVSCFKLAACKHNSSASAPAQLSRSAFSWKEFFLFPNAIWLYLQSWRDFRGSGREEVAAVDGNRRAATVRFWVPAGSLVANTDQSVKKMASDSTKICINASVCEYPYVKAFPKNIMRPP